MIVHNRDTLCIYTLRYNCKILISLSIVNEFFLFLKKFWKTKENKHYPQNDFFKI